jgi:dienelactone hydrolase
LVAVVIAAAVWSRSTQDPDGGSFERRRGLVVDVAADPAVSHALGFMSQNVLLRSDTGLQVELCVLRPTDAAGPLPAVVLLGGHRTGRDAVHLLGSPHGVAVVALNYPYDGPEKPKGLKQVFEVARKARKSLADTPSAALLAAEWLLAQEWVDSDNVEIAGVSMGVPFAAAAGALEPRFSRVWLIQGGADVRKWIEHNLGSGIPSGPLRWISARLLYRLAHGSRFEPEYWAPRIAPRPVVIIAARGDRRLPVGLVEQLDAAVTGPKEVIWIDGDHIDRRPEAIREILDLVLDRLERESHP